MAEVPSLIAKMFRGANMNLVMGAGGGRGQQGNEGGVINYLDGTFLARAQRAL